MTEQELLFKHCWIPYHKFEIPILNKEPIWALLNVNKELYVKREGQDVIQTITYEEVSNYLTGNTESSYDTLYIWDKDYNLKDIVQPDFQKSEPVTIKAKNTIYDLKLHHSMYLDKFTQVQRVPGGWLYHKLHLASTDLQKALTDTTTFVPWESPIDQAELIVEVLNHLNEMGESIDVDTSGVLLNTIKEYLRKR
jgi:hypothetical protein